MLGFSLKYNFIRLFFFVQILLSFLYTYLSFYEKLHFMARVVPRVVNLLVDMLFLSFSEKIIVTLHLMRGDKEATVLEGKHRLRGERNGIKTPSLPLSLLFFLCFHFHHPFFKNLKTFFFSISIVRFSCHLRVLYFESYVLGSF